MRSSWDATDFELFVGAFFYTLLLQALLEELYRCLFANPTDWLRFLILVSVGLAVIKLILTDARFQEHASANRTELAWLGSSPWTYLLTIISRLSFFTGIYFLVFALTSAGAKRARQARDNELVTRVVERLGHNIGDSESSISNAGPDVPQAILLISLGLVITLGYTLPNFLFLRAWYGEAWSLFRTTTRSLFPRLLQLLRSTPQKGPGSIFDVMVWWGFLNTLNVLAVLVVGAGHLFSWFEPLYVAISAFVVINVFFDVAGNWAFFLGGQKLPLGPCSKLT